MYPHLGRRAFLATAVALSLAACDPPGSDDDEKGTPIPGAPGTVDNAATWMAKVASNAPVVLTPLGILTFSPDAKSGQVAPMLLDPSSGKVRWAAAGVDQGESAALHWISRDGRSWAVLVTEAGVTATITVWDGLSGVTKDLAPTSSGSYSGEVVPPKVSASGSGLLVYNIPTSAPFAYIPDTGQITRYGQGPQRNGVDGTPVAAVAADSFLVGFPGGTGFSLSSPSGGWASNTAGVPKGADPNTGVVLAVSKGYVVSQWGATDPTPGVPIEGEIIALHALSNGSLKGQYRMTGDEFPQIERRGTDRQTMPIIPDVAQTHVAWGSFVFDLVSGQGTHLVLNGAEPTALIENMLYADGAKAPLPQASAASDGGGSQTSAASDGGGAQASSASDGGGEKGFTGKVAVDVTTRIPLSGEIEASTYGLSVVSQVIVGNAKQNMVFSTRLK